MAHDAFISYSSKDKTVADATCAVLESRGIRCWMAPRDILPTADWSESIIDGINSAKVFVLVFSSNANTSKHVKREVERAVHHGLPLIPLRIEEVLPAKSLELFLSTPHWLDAFTPPLEQHLKYLSDIVWHILHPETAPPAPPPPPPPKRRWIYAATAAAAIVLSALAAALWHSSEKRPMPHKPADTFERPIAATAARPADGDGLEVPFAKVDTLSAPHYQVVAEPYLRAGNIRMRVTDKIPPGSHVVLTNNLALYEGKAVLPTHSQNFLTQTDTGNVPATFTLSFSHPVQKVTFVVPGVYPETESGVTFPAWRAVALSARGAELSSASEALTRRMKSKDGRKDDVDPRTYTLIAPAFDGISAVRFDSDPNLNGRPFAAFSTILIERITVKPLE